MSEDLSRNIDLLFEPLVVGSVTLANRIVVPPMVSNRALSSDAAVRWYGRLAAEGPGLVIVEATRIHRFQEDYTAEAIRPVVEAIHSRGAKAAIQLFPIPLGESWAPSDLSRERIDDLVRQFAHATSVCIAAGFDGVEPHGAHGYLVNQFFSPKANAREDGYGGSVENRCRFSLEVARACREAAGDALLLYRHTPVESESYGIEDSFVLTDRLVEIGVDVLDISPGGFRRPGELSAPFKERYARTPIITVWRMEVVTRAVEAIRERRADLIAVGRGMLVDASWPRKVRERQLDEIEQCEECSVGCFDRLWAGELVGCVKWPDGYHV
ncbi:MAG: hypothetical protein JXQ73_18100 [Phycisphaerae bacterium]|nr:hypothetical protein [Phycisphaerae bacterium]